MAVSVSVMAVPRIYLEFAIHIARHTNWNNVFLLFNLVELRRSSKALYETIDPWSKLNTRYKFSIPTSRTHARTHTKCNGDLWTFHICSIYWEDYYRAGDYPSLFPRQCPRLVDPANPANNVYESGIGPYPANDRSEKYEYGNGDWVTFAAKIDLFDFEKSVGEINRQLRWWLAV